MITNPIADHRVSVGGGQQHRRTGTKKWYEAGGMLMYLVCSSMMLENHGR